MSDNKKDKTNDGSDKKKVRTAVIVSIVILIIIVLLLVLLIPRCSKSNDSSTSSNATQLPSSPSNDPTSNNSSNKQEAKVRIVNDGTKGGVKVTSGNGVVNDGSNVSIGDEIIIEPTPNTGNKAIVEVTGAEQKVGSEGYTYIVTGSTITITITYEFNSFDLLVTEPTNGTITIKRGDETLYPVEDGETFNGTDLLKYNDSLNVTFEAQKGYRIFSCIAGGKEVHRYTVPTIDLVSENYTVSGDFVVSAEFTGIDYTFKFVDVVNFQTYQDQNVKYKGSDTTLVLPSSLVSSSNVVWKYKNGDTFVFDEWVSNPTADNDFVVTLYAFYTSKPTINATVNDSSMGTIKIYNSSDEEISYIDAGEKIKVVVEPTSKYYKISYVEIIDETSARKVDNNNLGPGVEWTIDTINNDPLTQSAKGLTVKACFVGASIGIKYTSDDMTSYIELPKDGSTEYGTSTKISEPTMKSGYAFSRWKVKNDGPSSKYIELSNLTISDWSSYGSDTILTEDANDDYDYILTLQAMSVQGYALKVTFYNEEEAFNTSGLYGYYGDQITYYNDGTTANKSLTATYDGNKRVTLTGTVGATQSIIVGAPNFNYYQFDNWVFNEDVANYSGSSKKKGDVFGTSTSEQQQLTFSMPQQNLSIAAKYVGEQKTLTFEADKSGTGTVEASVVDADGNKTAITSAAEKNVHYGDTIELTATPADGYTFTKWQYYLNGETTSKSDLTESLLLDDYKNTDSTIKIEYVVAYGSLPDIGIVAVFEKYFGANPVYDSDANTMTYGLYPQDYVGDTLNNTLNKIWNEGENGTAGWYNDTSLDISSGGKYRDLKTIGGDGTGKYADTKYYYYYEDDFYYRVEVSNNAQYNYGCVKDESAENTKGYTQLVPGSVYWFKCSPITLNKITVSNKTYYIPQKILCYSAFGNPLASPTYENSDLKSAVESLEEYAFYLGKENYEVETRVLTKQECAVLNLTNTVELTDYAVASMDASVELYLTTYLGNRYSSTNANTGYFWSSTIDSNCYYINSGNSADSSGTLYGVMPAIIVTAKSSQ